MPTYWLVTMFDGLKRKEQFHVEGRRAVDAMGEMLHTLLVEFAVNSKYEPTEIHVQLITPEEKDSLLRRRP